MAVNTRELRQPRNRAARRSAPRPRRPRLDLEALELRTVLSTSRPTQVVGFDLLTRTETILPADTALESGIQELRSEGFRGVGDLFRDTPQDGPGTTNVHGPDDRVRVTNTQDYAWRTVGRMRIRFGANETWCSGSMINTFQFLTAGHCVHNGNWATLVNPAMGRDRDFRPYGEAVGVYIRSYTNWTVDRDADHDWALVTLDRRIGNFTGWLGYRSRPNSWFNGGGLTSAGYPQDRSVNGVEMYRIAGPSAYATGDQDNTKGRVYYTGTMDTAGGQSGSGVWDSEFYNVAVHAYGGATHNSGTRLIQEKVNRLLTWVAEDGTQRPPTDRADLVDYDAWFSTNFAYFSPTTVLPGQSLTTRSVVRNNGTANAGSFRVSFYASTDTTITTGDRLLGSTTISSLNALSWADAIQTSAVPTSIPAGQYYVGWIFDTLGQVGEFDESNNTGVITASRLTVLPAAPSFLTATAVSSSRINLAWQDVQGETGYRIERSLNGATWSFLTNVGANVTSYADTTGLAIGTRYYYRVAGLLGANQGNYSPSANALTLALGSFSITGFPASVAAGAAFSFTVTARDTGGNVATNYVGTVTFTSSDAAATRPPNTTFLAANNGVRAFTNQTILRTPGSQTVRVADTVNAAAFGQVSITVNPINVLVNATAGNDIIFLRNQGGNANLYEVVVNGVVQSQGWWLSLSAVTLNGLAGNDSITVARVRAGLPVTVNGGVDDDTITIPTLGEIAGPLAANGDGGTDTLTANDQAAAAGQDIYVTATTLRRTGTGTITYATLESLAASASSAGFTALNITSTATNTPVDLVGTGENYLLVQSGIGVFEIWGPDAGRLTGDTIVSPVTFTGVGNLVGGVLDDYFYFYNGAGVSGFIDGLGGSNIFDYSEWTTGVFVELHNGIAQGTAAIGNIHHVFGGSGPDYLHGDGVANWLVGNAGEDILVGDEGDDYIQAGDGRDLVFGGGGSDYMEGGLEDDLLIDGTTSYDYDPAALDQIWLEWTRLDVDYYGRIDNLRNGTGLSSVLLDANNVFSDGIPDGLIGEDGLDWFWVGDGDFADVDLEQEVLN